MLTVIKTATKYEAGCETKATMNEIDGETEEQRVRRMRNNYAIIDSNSLVRWMNSDAWTEAPRVEDWRGNRLARGHKIPGITRNEVHGEIQCR